jgi:hypothetical protein
MGATPAVLVANYGPLIRGLYTMSVVALSPTGTAVDTYTSAPFQI